LIKKINKKIWHLNHYDLDAVACGLVLKNTFEYVKMVPTGYGKLPKIILNIEKHLTKEKFDYVYITDLNLEINQLKFINKVCKKLNIPFIYIDHHESNIELIHNPKKNRFVFIEQSAGVLTKNYIETKYNLDLSFLNEFLKYSNDYDLWKHKYKNSKKLNHLFEIYHPHKMIKRFINGFDKFNEMELKHIAKCEQEIENEWENLDISDTPGWKISSIILKNGKYINDMAERCLELDNLDVLIIFYGNDKISVRAKNEDVNVAETLTRYNLGGGHKYAGGCEFVKKFNSDDENYIYNLETITKAFTDDYGFLNIVF